jgi:serine/threonine protein kinase
MGQHLTTADDSTTIDLPAAAGEPLICSSEDQIPSAEGEIGRVLRDRYVLVARLGSGGKGSVYKALDRYRAHLPEGQQYVAIKILHAGVANREERLASLRNEFYRTQMLSHRNIVNVFELDRDDDVDFFTMEFLEGDLLSSVIHRMQPLPMARHHAWEIIRAVGSGLECAHAHNIVHADLKPNNIMVTESGEVRILDFGSSSISAEKAAQGVPSSGNLLSSVTPAYACCELLEGRSPDPRDDIYALACLSYELLAGAHPFQRRRSTEARDYGIVPIRPSGLSRQQWQALTMGLSWHRARRSISMSAWLYKLNTGRVMASLPPARDLKSSPMKPSLFISFPATALLGVLLICAIAWFSVAGLAGRKMRENGLVSAGAASVQLNGGTGPTSENAGLAATSAMHAPLKPTGAKAAPQSEALSQAVTDLRPEVNHPKLTSELTNRHWVSASDSMVRAGERFAEIRIHRSSRMGSDIPLVWWTEAASAKPGIDYVPQGKAIQSFPKGKSTTSFFVKLFPTAFRTRPEVFYIAIAAPARGTLGQIARAAVWLPTNDSQSAMSPKIDTSASTVGER